SRLHFLEAHVLKTLKLKADRWQKCLATEDYKASILEFLDRAEPGVLTVSLSPAGQLVPAADFPAGNKNKVVFFAKKRKEALSVESLRNNVVYGDLSYSPLEQFAALVEEVRK
uniref:Uncharacterized protein n=1 Tax=Latimeria chalumnae TaxID=7897 RepID=H2ZU70_LATCH